MDAVTAQGPFGATGRRCEMAWEISMADDGWRLVRLQLDTWPRERLIEALTDDRFEEIQPRGGSTHAMAAAAALRRRIESLPHDTLADAAYDQVVKTGTSKAGGGAVYIDREGYWTVDVQCPYCDDERCDGCCEAAADEA